MPIRRIEYPAWHDEARKLRSSGMTHNQLADKFGVSAARMSQIATDNWKSYRIAGQYSHPNRPTIAEASKDSSKYEFVPVPEPSPKEREEERKAKLARAEQYRAKYGDKKEPEMAKEREFEVVKKLHEGKILVGAKITCSGCGKSENYYNNRGSVTPSHLPKEFERMGWAVGKSPRADKCPECLAKLKGKPIDAPKPAPAHTVLKDIPTMDLTVMSSTSDAAAKTLADQIVANSQVMEATKAIITVAPNSVSLKTADPSQPMGRTERRIVFAKLEEVYQDETTGYRDDWTDAKVADDLGVPVAWIKEVRDDNFGPEITKETKEQAKRTLDKLAEDGERLILLIDKKAEQLQALDNKMKEALEAMDAAIDRADQLSKSIEIEDKKMEELFRRFDATAAEFKENVAAYRR